MAPNPCPAVALLAARENTALLLARQVQRLVGNRITVDPYWAYGGPPVPANVDLILISSPSLASMFASGLPPGIPVLVARRVLDGTALKEVLQIPRGSKVMLVNDHRDSTMEVLSLLYEYGVEHLDLLPYWPGAPVPEAETAITANEPHLVPEGVSRVINVGSRVIDPTTILDLMTKLNVLDGAGWQRIAGLAGEIPSSLGLRTALDRMRYLKEQAEVVLNLVQDAVIAVDEEGSVALTNQAARQLFGVDDVIGRRLEQILPALAEALTGLDDSFTDQVLAVDDRKLIATAIPLLRPGASEGRVIMFKEIATVQRLDAKVRRELRRDGHTARYTFDQLIGISPSFRATLEKARRLTHTDATVLILGESGTGKELFAQAIHNASPRRPMPFVAVNCAAMPDSLLESELFGYVDGAFTGARRGGKPGLFEQAHRGTIFLDEVGDISPALQIRLLRVLQEKEVMRIGGSGVTPIDVRVIAATHQDLRGLVEAGRFRSDLYYRLNVLRLAIPPLRERREDILPLLHHFLAEAGRPMPVALEAVAALECHTWPGNVRELENCAQYLAVVASGRVTVEDLPDEVQGRPLVSQREEPAVVITQMTPDLLFLLRALQNDPDGAMGRPALARLSAQQGLPLTEQEVRHRLSQLAGLGLVRPARGRSGTQLTVEGRRLLESFR